MIQEIFNNPEVDLELLPSANHLSWHPLQRSYKSMLLLSTAFGCAVFIGAVSIALPFANLPGWLVLSIVGLVVLISVIQILAVLKGFPYKGYAIRTRDLLYRSGWLYRKEIAVPFIRIQHVEIRQGLFERAFGLSRINIYTAGGESSDLTIPGLREVTAQRLKEYILKETGSWDEEE